MIDWITGLDPVEGIQFMLLIVIVQLGVIGALLVVRRP